MTVFFFEKNSKRLIIFSIINEPNQGVFSSKIFEEGKEDEKYQTNINQYFTILKSKAMKKGR